MLAWPALHIWYPLSGFACKFLSPGQRAARVARHSPLLTAQPLPPCRCFWRPGYGRLWPVAGILSCPLGHTPTLTRNTPRTVRPDALQTVHPPVLHGCARRARCVHGTAAGATELEQLTLAVLGRAGGGSGDRRTAYCAGWPGRIPAGNPAGWVSAPGRPILPFVPIEPVTLPLLGGQCRPPQHASAPNEWSPNSFGSTKKPSLAFRPMPPMPAHRWTASSLV
jgi:hypothetical protein